MISRRKLIKGIGLAAPMIWVPAWADGFSSSLRPLRFPAATEETASFTLNASHAGKLVPVNSASQVDVTVADIPIGIPVLLEMTGTSFIRVLGTSTLTVTPDPGFSTASLTGSGASVRITRISSTAFVVDGDLSREALKGYSNIHGAYSSRRLVAGHTGRAFLLRETGASVDLGIGFDANGNFDDNAAFEHEGGNALAVDTVYDQSGNSRNFTQQAADADQPALTRNDQSGHPSMVFDGTSDYLERTVSGDSLYNDSTNLTMVMAASVATGQGNTYFYGEVNETDVDTIYRLGTGAADDKLKVAAQTDGGTLLGTELSDSAVLDGSFGVYSFLDAAGSISFRNDAVADGTGSIVRGTLTIDRAGIGGGADSVPLGFADMSLGEMILFADTVPTVELRQLEQNMIRYWGV